MTVIAFEATELKDATVERVAMVKRGANRTPFKVLKSEDGEIMDLNDITRSLFAKKADPAKPGAVVGVIIHKSTVESEVIRDLLINGKLFDADPATLVKSEKDGTIRMVKADVKDAADLVLVKAADDVVLVVSGAEAFKKEFTSYNFDSTMFQEIAAQGTYYPSVYMASDMLGNAISNIMEKVDNPKDAATQVAKACKDFGDYVTTLTKALPTKAFKADGAINAHLAKSEKVPVVKDRMTIQQAIDADAANRQLMDGSGFAAATVTVQQPAYMIPPGYELGMDQTGASFLFKKAEDGTILLLGPKAKEQTQKAGDTQPAPDKGLSDMIKTLFEAQSTSLKKELEGAVGGLRTELKDLSGRVEKADKTVSGLVLGNVERDDEEGKDSKEPAAPLGTIDTAYTKVDAAKPRQRRVHA